MLHRRMRMNPALQEINRSFTAGMPTGTRKAGCVMSYNEIPILHRAFALARTGEYGRVEDLEKALAAEGYARNDPQLQSPSVRKQLRRLCRATIAAAAMRSDEAVA
jgi:hypothetical protein